MEELKLITQIKEVDYPDAPEEFRRRCAIRLIYSLPLATPVMGRSVESIRQMLGAQAAQLVPDSLLERLDYICPIPHSGLPYGEGAAKALGIPMVQAVKKTSHKRSFPIEDEAVRDSFFMRSMEIDEELVKGACVCLVDEAIFTGNTMKFICRRLRSCGVKEIHVLIPTPPCASGCVHGAASSRRMLLEWEDASRLPEILGADSVIFQSKSVFASLLEESGMGCCECFLG